MKLLSQTVGMIETNCYMVVSEQNHCAVIDPGADADRLIQMLEQNYLNPSIILLTHGHYDHIGAVNALVQKYHCLVMIGEEDADMLGDDRKSLAFRLPNRDSYHIVCDRKLKDGDKITLDELTFEVINTPGHTKGGVTYRCGELLFTGDTLFAGDVGRCDLFGGDFLTLKNSLQRLKQLQGDPQVLPGHGPFSSLEREKRTNPYMGIREI